MQQCPGLWRNCGRMYETAINVHIIEDRIYDMHIFVQYIRINQHKFVN